MNMRQENENHVVWKIANKYKFMSQQTESPLEHKQVTLTIF